MRQPSIRIVITSPLEPELIERIVAVDPRLDVVYPRDLLPVARYPADHAAPNPRDPEALAAWRSILEPAEILFDFGPRPLVAELASWPQLRWIQATSAGVGQFAARFGLDKSRIVVTTASGVHARPLAEFALMAMLMFGKGAFRLLADQRAHRWERYAGEELAARVVGIVGVGRIGREVARVARGLDARVIGTTRSVAGRPAGDLFLDRLVPTDELDAILGELDFLVLTCPHTPETEGLINAERLALLKPSAVLINLARGAVVDEPALIAALQAGRLAGAALDVVAQEPLPAESPLWDLPNVLISPHSASTAIGENGKITDLFCDNLQRYLEGCPLRNVLDYALLY
ncbi:MAG TPA: D-2-hydroxyacid dehydrogenase [Chloroflexota bacterium]|nr:D-2-hydroxyacid dehydrogenase [Chloroflexota bacterium]